MIFPLSRQDRIRYKLNLKKYLEELKALTGGPVVADSLGSVEQAVLHRTIGQKFCNEAVVSWEIPFSERMGERFKQYVCGLCHANPSPVYIWTPRTICCGTFMVSSLEAIKFDFDFAINPEGMLCFLSSDLEDRFLLDFSISASGEQMLKIEAQGNGWRKHGY